jgi:hypothetical protein
VTPGHGQLTICRPRDLGTGVSPTAGTRYHERHKVQIGATLPQLPETTRRCLTNPRELAEILINRDAAPSSMRRDNGYTVICEEPLI